MFNRIFALVLFFILDLRGFFIQVMRSNSGFAKVSGPFLSMTASGTVGNVLTACTWKGVAYMRKWFIPSNPQTAKQTNVRTALALLVAEWNTETDNTKAAWDSFAEGTGKSGFNHYVSRGMNKYILDPGIDVVPTSVSVAGAPPGDTFTWNAP